MNLLTSPEKEFQDIIKSELGNMNPTKNSDEKNKLLTYNSNGDE